MRPGLWSPPVGPSPAEQAVMRAVRRARLFVFLREHRHGLFDEGFQSKLAQAYADGPKGRPPVPRTLLALAVPACGRHHLGLTSALTSFAASSWVTIARTSATRMVQVGRALSDPEHQDDQAEPIEPDNLAEFTLNDGTR